MKLNNKIYYLILCLIAQYPAQYLFAEEVQKQTSEASFILQKFAVTMGLVALCLILLTGILYFYKKYFKSNIQQNEAESAHMSLESPKNLDQAVTSFFERTRSNR